MKFILINGPTGVGKSTLARSIHECMPMAFLLDLDAQRAFISHYEEHRQESGLLSFDIAAGIAEVCAERGRDFIMGKSIFGVGAGKHGYRNELDRLLGIGQKYAAEIYEIMLWADKETTLERVKQRGFADKPTLTIEKAAAYWDEFNAFRQERTSAMLVNTTDRTPEEVFDEVALLVGIRRQG